MKRELDIAQQERDILKTYNEVTRFKQVWSRFRELYGAPRIHAELQAQGLCVGRHRVARLMRRAGISGKSACKRRPRTTQSEPSHPVAPNLLDRQFKASRCDEVWLTDITYIDTDEGYRCLAAVMDLYSRQLVGLTMADHMRTELVDTALTMVPDPAPSIVGSTPPF